MSRLKCVILTVVVLVMLAALAAAVPSGMVIEDEAEPVVINTRLM